MSANNIVCLPQHKAVMVASDTAVYSRDGIITDFRSKIVPVNHWPGVVTGRGTAIASELLVPVLADMFQSFDDLISGIEAALPSIVAEIPAPIEFEMLIAGWSETRRAPESYMIQTAEMNCYDNTEDEIEEARAKGLIMSPYTLSRLPPAVSGPPLRTDAIIDASFEGYPDGPLEDIARVLRVVIEAQRQQPDRNGMHWVGGAAELAIVVPEGVQTMVVHRWEEDQVGAPVRPLPIDWAALRASIGLPPGFSAEKRAEIKAQIADLDRRLLESLKRPPGTVVRMSRLRRERNEKKARKGTLRSVPLGITDR